MEEGEKNLEEEMESEVADEDESNPVKRWKFTRQGCAVQHNTSTKNKYETKDDPKKA